MTQVKHEPTPPVMKKQICARFFGSSTSREVNRPQTPAIYIIKSSEREIENVRKQFVSHMILCVTIE